MKFKDLTHCHQTPEAFTTPPLAVGWISGWNYCWGRVNERRIQKLIKIYNESPFHMCEYSGGGKYSTLQTRYGPITAGPRTILIPSSDCLYQAPSAIIHHIIARNYCPPESFLQALDQVDLSNLVFVDMIAKTYNFYPHPSLSYQAKLGNLLTTQRGSGL